MTLGQAASVVCVPVPRADLGHVSHKCPALSPWLISHLLGGSSVGRAEVLAEFSVAAFQFLPFPVAMSDLNRKKK